MRITGDYTQIHNFINSMNNSDGKKLKKRIERGSPENIDLGPFRKMTLNRLIELLTDEYAPHRTAAAAILGSLKTPESIPALSEAMKHEKSLYCRIAQSKALQNIGEPAVPYLINLLGKIGDNQENRLPEKCFNKTGYPLIRDFAARTIAGIDKRASFTAINALIEVIDSNELLKIPMQSMPWAA